MLRHNLMNRLSRILCLTLAMVVAGGALAADLKPSPTLEAIRAKGEIVIGVKTDLPPFGALDANGKSVGMEVDIAREMAESLGVRLRTQGVSTENRFQRLEQGAIDVVIATAGDTKERRKIATAIEPNYFAESVNVLLPLNSTAREWSDLRGKTLCALQGAFFNKPITQRHIIELQLYRSIRDAELALQDQRCVGFLYTEAALQYLIKQPDWSAYKLALPPTLPTPWAIYIKRSESGTAFERLLGDLVAQWHRDSTLIKIESHWQTRPSQFLQNAHKLWSQKDAQGHFVCSRNEQGQWPIECRNQAFVTSEEATGLQGFGLWVKEVLGLPLTVIYDPYDAKRYFFGILWTLFLSAASIAGSLAVGFYGAKRLLSGSAVSKIAFKSLANFCRMTPPLLQMYLVFFGFGSLLHAHFDINLSPWFVAIFSLSLYHGAMIAFTLIESARIKQLNDPGFILTIRSLPSLVEHSAVGIRTALNNLTKATTIASAIAVPELLSATIAVMADQGNVDIMMNLLLVMFYFISVAWLGLVTWAENRLIRQSGGAPCQQ
jgi:polar amino acid transport system substrate-binding protein